MAEARPSSRSRTVKALVPIAVVVAAGFTFWRTVHSARSEPYSLSAAAAQGAWHVAVARPEGASEPTLILEPPPGFLSELFEQVFKRSMQSMRSPALGGIPLVLPSELRRAGDDTSSLEALGQLARAAGLENTPPVPRCIGHRRAPEPDARQQAYFAILDSPPFATFRANLAARMGAGFDPGALTPTLLLGTIESESARWLPLQATAPQDCLAPIVSGDRPAP